GHEDLRRRGYRGHRPTADRRTDPPGPHGDGHDPFRGGGAELVRKVGVVGRTAMPHMRSHWLVLPLALGLRGCQRAAPVNIQETEGLHDMHGNIFEWCRDWYHAKLPGGVDPDLYSARSTAQLNRTGDASRVRRGGCWADAGWPCRSAFRLRFEPERRYDHIGFRVVAVQP